MSVIVMTATSDAIGRRQGSRPPPPRIRPGLLDPIAERRLRQIEIAGRRGHDLALVEDQPHRPGLEFVTEAASGSFPFRLGHRGHRIRLSESVHETGSSPWGKVKLTIWTHKIDGLTESDFIFAARADQQR